MTEKFWFVWQPEGLVPRCKHDSLESATREAQRLAEFTSGRSFYVLEAVSESKKVSVITTQLEESTDFPF